MMSCSPCVTSWSTGRRASRSNVMLFTSSRMLKFSFSFSPASSSKWSSLIVFPSVGGHLRPAAVRQHTSGVSVPSPGVEELMRWNPAIINVDFHKFMGRHSLLWIPLKDLTVCVCSVWQCGPYGHHIVPESWTESRHAEEQGAVSGRCE